MRKPSPYSCANCGYPLTGLGSIGSCPECGNLYNTNSGKGVNMRPHEMHIAPERNGLIAKIILHGIVIAFLALMGYVITWIPHIGFNSVIYKEFILGMIALNSVIRIYDSYKRLGKLKPPI